MYEVLESIGLSRNESKTYLALLELGFTPAGTIARKAKIERTNAYDSLEKLRLKGLVGFISKAGTRHYEAAQPKFLKRMLQEKEKKLESIMPQLELTKEMSGNENETNLYEGLKPLTNMLDGLIDYEETILVIGESDVSLEKLRFFLPHFNRKRISKEIDMKQIFSQNNSTTYICGNEVILVSWDKNITSVHVKNKNIADAYKEHFCKLS